MSGKTVVVTGATSGIGEVAADRLATKGARIVFIARDPQRGEATLKHLQAIAPDRTHAVYYADLSLLADMKRVGAEIAAAEARIDVLINNAGAAFATRQVTEDGFEKTFALNHLSYFVLTNLLLPRIGEGGRIVSTASAAHRGAKLDFDDLQSSKRYSLLGAYARSKLCNILFTRELARRLEGAGITANCLHPGVVGTRFGSNNGGLLGVAMGLARNFMLTPEQGAETLIYLASSPAVSGVTGGYFAKCRPAEISREGRDDAVARRLWDVSARLCGMEN